MKSICFFTVLWGVPVPYLDTIVSVAILFSVSIRFVCHFVMFLWSYISRQFCVFIIASNTLLFHLEICYKKKPFPALKRLFPFGTRHPFLSKHYLKYLKIRESHLQTSINIFINSLVVRKN